jgi:hypothetical protein
MTRNKTLTPFLLAALALLIAHLGRQMLALLRSINLYLHRISADARQQNIEMQVITAGLTGLTECLEIYHCDDSHPPAPADTWTLPSAQETEWLSAAQETELLAGRDLP